MTTRSKRLWITRSPMFSPEQIATLTPYSGRAWCIELVNELVDLPIPLVFDFISEVGEPEQAMGMEVGDVMACHHRTFDYLVENMHTAIAPSQIQGDINDQNPM